MDDTHGDTSSGYLDLWPRQHDVPPRWDGLPVEWDEWSEAASIFICPPPPGPPDRCSHCGWTRPPLMKTGRVWADMPDGVQAIGRARLNKETRVLAAVITLFRCAGCTRDRVLDHEGEMWDLDPTDYTDDGSSVVA